MVPTLPRGEDGHHNECRAEPRKSQEKNLPPIAARVRALAAADEIVVTDDVLSLAGARELVVGLEIDSSGVELKGIAGEVRIHRLRRALDEG